MSWFLAESSLVGIPVLAGRSPSLLCQSGGPVFSGLRGAPLAGCLCDYMAFQMDRETGVNSGFTSKRPEYREGRTAENVNLRFHGSGSVVLAHSHVNRIQHVNDIGENAPKYPGIV